MATPNMTLDLPTVSVTVGPTYATQNNAAFTLVDSHDHTTGKGVQVPSDGININADLEFNDFSATELKSVDFESQAAAITGANFLQTVDGELYFNDGSSNSVQITDGGALDITSSGGIGGDYTSAGASVSFNNTTNAYTFTNGSAVQSILIYKGFENTGKVEQNTTAVTSSPTLTDTDGNYILLVDTSAARTITLPDPTLGNRVFVVKDTTGTSETNNITMARNGSENIDGVAASKVLSYNYGSWRIISDGTDWWTVGDSKAASLDFLQLDVSNSQTIPNSASGFASVPINSALVDPGGFVLSTNTVTFPRAGWYKATIEVQGATSDSGASLGTSIEWKLRNTTDSTDVFQDSEQAISCGFISTEEAESTNGSMSYFFQILSTKIADDYEFQWVTTNSVTVTCDMAMVYVEYKANTNGS